MVINVSFVFVLSLLYGIGELSREEDVLEWLIENKSTGDDEDVIEDVSLKTLNTLIGNVDHLVVLFCKDTSLYLDQSQYHLLMPFFDPRR